MSILGDLYVGIEMASQSVRTVGSYRMIKDSRQGSVNKWYVYKGTESGSMELVKYGSMTECSKFLDDVYN